MASTSAYVTYLFVACLLWAQQVSSARGERFGTPHDMLTRSYGGDNLVGLLKTSLKGIYDRNVRILQQELLRNLALVDSAVRGDQGPMKRDSTTSTSLGGGALYFLAREVAQSQSQSSLAESVLANQKLFEQAG